MLNSFSHPPPPPHNRTLREEEEADSLLGGRLHSFQEDQKEIEKMMAMKKKKKETTITSPNDRMVLSMIGFLHPTQQSHAMVNASNTPPLHEEEEEQEEEEEEEEDDLMGDLLFGAAKIKDGLFIGDLHAAQDLDFLMSNKITHIVNCSCIDTPNFFQDPRHYHLGIAYLSFPWTRHEPAQSFLENETEGLLSRKIFYFIERCLEKGESCLIQSARGQSRACMVLIAYLMEKYLWSLSKAEEFLESRRPHMEIERNHMKQLTQIEAYLTLRQKRTLSKEWTVPTPCVSLRGRGKKKKKEGTHLNEKGGEEEEEEGEKKNKTKDKNKKKVNEKKEYEKEEEEEEEEEIFENDHIVVVNTYLNSLHYRDLMKKKKKKEEGEPTAERTSLSSSSFLLLDASSSQSLSSYEGGKKKSLARKAPIQERDTKENYKEEEERRDTRLHESDGEREEAESVTRHRRLRWMDEECTGRSLFSTSSSSLDHSPNLLPLNGSGTSSSSSTSSESGSSSSSSSSSLLPSQAALRSFSSSSSLLSASKQGGEGDTNGTSSTSSTSISSNDRRCPCPSLTAWRTPPATSPAVAPPPRKFILKVSSTHKKKDSQKKKKHMTYRRPA